MISKKFANVHQGSHATGKRVILGNFKISRILHKAMKNPQTCNIFYISHIHVDRDINKHTAANIRSYSKKNMRIRNGADILVSLRHLGKIAFASVIGRYRKNLWPLTRARNMSENMHWLIVGASDRLIDYFRFWQLPWFHANNIRNKHIFY